MHNYHILFQSLHLHVSVCMTIFTVLIEYITVVLYKVQYVNAIVLDFAQDNTDVPCEYPEDGHVDGNM
jgi:hypothetical protein